MKKLIVLLITCILVSSLAIAGLAASSGQAYATIDKVTEEVLSDGTMTGRKIVIGTISRPVARYTYSEPTARAFTESPFGVKASISNKIISGTEARFTLKCTYRYRVYVYMGGFEAMEPTRSSSWFFSVPR